MDDAVLMCHSTCRVSNAIVLEVINVRRVRESRISRTEEEEAIATSSEIRDVQQNIIFQRDE